MPKEKHLLNHLPLSRHLSLDHAHLRLQVIAGDRHAAEPSEFAAQGA